MSKKRISLVKTFQLISVISLVLLAILFMGFQLVTRTKDFNERAETMRSDLANHTVLISKQGIEYHIASQLRPRK